MPAGLIRRYQITVLSPPSEGSAVKRVIRDNHISASFHYNSTSTQASPDVHQLTIYNPSKEDIVALREKGAKIIVQAGYLYEDGTEITYEDLPSVFKGEIVKSDISRTNTDTKAVVELSQGFTELRKGTIAETFKAGTLLTDILTLCAKSLNLPFSIKLGDLSSLAISSPQTFNGPTTEVLEATCDRYNLRWYLEEEKLYIVSKANKAAAKAGATPFSQVNNRIKGTTSWTIDDTTDTGGAKSTQVNLNLFLYPILGLGDTIHMDIEDASIAVVIDSIKHVLDLYGDDWDTKIVASSKEESTETK